jgi:MFS family permease
MIPFPLQEPKDGGRDIEIPSRSSLQLVNITSGYQYLSEEATPSGSSPAPQDISLEVALERIPVGKFHLKLLTICGLSFMSDSIEVSLLSFLSLFVAAEWNLSVAQLASITAIVFAGSLLGASVIWGPIADRYGRRVSFLLGSFLISVCSLASALSPNYICLIFFRFFVGVGVGSGFVPFDLLAEFLPSSHRGQYLMNINYFWTMGSMIVNGSAWIFLDSYGWRVFTVVSSLPVLLGAILAVIYLPESPRWLLHQQRTRDAEEVIHYAAKINETEMNPFHLLPMTTPIYAKLPSSSHSLSHETDTDSQYETHSTTENTLHSMSTADRERTRAEGGGTGRDREVDIERQQNRTGVTPATTPSQQSDHSSDEISWEQYLNLLHKDYASITIPLWIVYLGYGFTYYGAILFISRLYSSESNEPHPEETGEHKVSFNYFDIFTNACSEVVGVFLAANIIDRIGRRISQFSLYGLAAFSVLLLPFTTSTFRYLISLICRISILAACGITWVATPELYPTSMRAVGHSLCTAFSRIGAIISPYVIQNQLMSEQSIGVVLCLVNLISMFSIACLPETLGKSMESKKSG